LCGRHSSADFSFKAGELVAGAAPAAAYFSVFTAGCIQRGDHGLDGRLGDIYNDRCSIYHGKYPHDRIACYLFCLQREEKAQTGTGEDEASGSELSEIRYTDKRKQQAGPPFGDWSCLLF